MSHSDAFLHHKILIEQVNNLKLQIINYSLIEIIRDAQAVVVILKLTTDIRSTTQAYE
jgi:hypothetical protein